MDLGVLGCILLPWAPLSSPKGGREGEGKATLLQAAKAMAMHAASTQGWDLLLNLYH